MNWKALGITLSKSPTSIVDWLVDTIEFVLFRAAEVATPVPSMLSVYFSLATVWDSWAAWIVAIVVEISSLGLGRFIGTMRARGNSELARLGILLYSAQMFVIWSVVICFKVGPALFAAISLGGMTDDLIKNTVFLFFPVLTVVGSVLLGVREHVKQEDARAERAAAADNREEDLQFNVASAKAKLELEDLAERMRIERDTLAARAAQRLEADRARAANKLEPRARDLEPRARGSDTQAAILEAIRKAEEENIQLLTNVDVGNAAGIQRRTAGQHLDRMAQEGLIHKNGAGWRLGRE